MRSLALKRFIDVTISVSALVLFSPILFLLALMVRIAMGPPIIFRQRRPGLHGTLFILYKFRTMRPPTGPDPTADDQKRLSRVGRFLRSTSLDELPEFFNVLKGEMSLVGPRPLIPDYLKLYSPRQSRRHEVKPGLTGWAQIHGRNAVSWEKRLELDVWYVENWSNWLDIIILARTIQQVASRKGVSAAGYATMPRFEGTKENTKTR